ncbi:thioesterase II family protein [Streptomyces sp. NPDC058534]|uniref:thioesterase II family protein n=1 Tax=Streptomyces sp. NPDC058534 TaxID=3346541 RepID=UPI003662E18A
MTRDTQAETWLMRFGRQRGDGPAVVCFPHAGGSASAFVALDGELAPHCDVLAVQYPGRHERYREQSALTIEELADPIAQALNEELHGRERPYALFGHSMGAVVAFEVARRLERGGHGPAHLLVSGRAAPSDPRTGRLHRQPDDALLAELDRLGGTPEGLLQDADVRALLLPPLRADYRAVETYVYAPGPALACPVTVLVGDRDPMVSVSEAARWQRHTASACAVRVFHGGHFYLWDHVAEVARTVTASLGRKAARRPGAERRVP